MKIKCLSLVLAVVIVALLPQAGFAVPALQLFIEDGAYDTTTETWVTSSDEFVLSAFATEPTDDVILCVALSSDLYTLDADGNVILNPGTTITIELEDGTILTQDDLYFEYGLPPISELNEDGTGGDLAPHDVYPTAFAEVKVDITNSGTIFDTQPNSDGTFDSYQPGYIYDFSIDDAVGGIHFDLYTLDGRDRIDKFAPFSHDAETIDKNGVVPEPSTLLLLGSGLTILPVARYLKRKRNRS